MEFVVALSCFLALIGLVMLLLWSIERIEARLRRMAPRLFNSWLQLHAIAALTFAVACIIVWPAPAQALTFNVLVVPIMAASLAYLAPLAFGLVVAIHTPDVLVGLMVSACRYVRDRAAGWRRHARKHGSVGE